MNEKQARKLKKFYHRSLTQALKEVQKLPLRLRIRWAWAAIFKKGEL